jgi:glycerate kinase
MPLQRPPIRTILLAPASFKGSLTAREVAEAMAVGVRRRLPDSRITLHPVSDGGEGLLDVLIPALDGHRVDMMVHGPLPGMRVKAGFGISADGRAAIVEMAQAAGLLLISEAERDPCVTTTFGVGELMRAALDHGVEKLVVGIGGSATNDAGTGMASALGARFLDVSGMPLPPGGAALERLASIHLRDLDPRLSNTTIIVACDVQNLLTGPDGAAHVYAPQKGASPSDVLLLERALGHFAEVVRRTLGKDIASIPGGGAAGGLGAGLAAFCGGCLQPGIEVVLDLTGFDAHLREADLVLTGEGQIDAQTTFGKAPRGVLARARAFHKPSAAVVGNIAMDRRRLVGADSFDQIVALVDGRTPKEEAIRNARELVTLRTEELIAMLVPS